ncbi:hypothetical protein [Pontibacillus yanchengensis]|uniref:Uncharacterized protein n=1 Tax=Pontibacillus yanchengensis Y32 TaxID=1385514 RepID=A0A0A2T780_9BACI|nr:hypothetical protein [Pontibacillus yanchengensis]KGP71672.1 hypothetical protein N782_17685 [Pontibacillus yanchengensis Y32]
MIKSVKGQFVLHVMTAILFVISSLLHFINLANPTFISILFYFIMVSAVFNAGLATERYLKNKK